MSMCEQDLQWRRDRIFWKANKHGLLEKRCLRYSELTPEVKSSLEAEIPSDTDPVLVFLGEDGQWTVIGTTKVCSSHGGNVYSCALDEIGRSIELLDTAGVDPQGAKRDSEYIFLRNPGVLVWCHPGAEIFALISILRMFPLSRPK